MSTDKILSNLKKYPDIDTLLVMWGDDSSPLTETNYAHKMSFLTSLHSKYLSIMVYTEKDCKKIQQEKKLLYAKLERYYGGKSLEGEDYLDPNLRPKTKTDITKYIEHDLQYLNLCSKLHDVEIIRDSAKIILEFIKIHSYNLNKFFDYIKYTTGG